MRPALCSALVFIVFMFSFQASAASLVENEYGVIGIENLLSGSQYYDVLFYYDSYNDLWEDPSETTFLNNRVGALQAANDANSFLKSKGVSSLIPVGGTTGYIWYYIPFAYNTDNDTSIYSYNLAVYTDQTVSRTTDRMYAKFSAVPIPGAALLFGSSLIGIMGIRKKLRK